MVPRKFQVQHSTVFDCEDHLGVINGLILLVPEVSGRLPRQRDLWKMQRFSVNVFYEGLRFYGSISDGFL